MNNPELLKVYNFDKKIRLGANGDGGYVIADLGNCYDCYISAGISIEESFSRDFINKYNTTGYGFDGTILHYPHGYTDKVEFIKKNINVYNDNNNTNLIDLIIRYNNIFLKMDIEGGEYPWILNLHEFYLSRFKQIVIEVHGLTNDEWGATYNEKVACLEKLNRTHYIVHAHANNFGPVVNKIPNVMELTYVNKNHFEHVPPFNKQDLPNVYLDVPNNPLEKDIDLNYYPFKE
jgi:hypothetical protein